MAEEPRTDLTAWPVEYDWLRIFGAAKMALHPAKLVLALVSLVLTFAWGTALDGAWKLSGQGEDGMAIVRFAGPESTATAELQTEELLASKLLAAAIKSATPGGAVDATVPSTEANHGIFELWRDHSLSHVQSALHATTDLNFRGRNSVWHSAGMLCHGTRWMVSQHFFFAILFLLGTLAIWSFGGGAICRIAAVQFACDEKIGIRQALRFTRERFFSGFFVSPLLPLCIMLVIGLLLSIGGFFLWIPGIGNIFSVLFVLALLGGLAIAFVLIGCVGGGSFFWPTVAVEGSDGFDAISRSFSYFFGRPLKTIIYGLIALVWGGICWVIFQFVLWMALRITHACVSFGVGGFCTHWWGIREEAGEGMTKLDVLWRAPITDLYSMGDRAHMGGWEIFAAMVIGIWVLIAIGLLWSFLASFYFSSSTIVYYLLRRDVDATDYDDVYIDEEEEEAYEEEMEQAKPPAAEAPQQVEEDVPPPAASLAPEPAPPPEPEEQPDEPTDEKPDESPGENT